MRKMFQILSSSVVAGVSILVALGCASQKTAFYNVSLASVESPANAKEQFGETKVVSFLDQASSITKYSYEDDYISIIWYVDNRQFNFTLHNKSNHTIKINWDDISYVDYNGQVGRVMHSGVKYNEKNNSQPSSLIPKGASISDLLMPTENVYWLSGQYGGWQEAPLIPNVKKADAATSTYIGKTMAILLPIYIEDVRNDYTFKFSIDSYTKK